MITFPAPEEARTYKAFVALFKERNPGVDFKEACKFRPGSHKEYYDECWRQPEAESIYQIYQQH